MFPKFQPPYSQEVHDEATSYDLTTDVIDVPPSGISQALVESLFYRATEGDRSVVPVLITLIKKHPEYPVFSNYLSNFYHQLGKTRQALAVERENLRVNPNYIFSRINLAANALEKGRLDDVREILGENLRLSEFHRTDRKIHIAEWSSFYQIVCLYYIGKDDLLAAQSIINAFYHYGLEDEKLGFLENSIVSARMHNMKQRMLEDERTRIRVKMPKSLLRAGKMKYHEPQHEILNRIYEYQYNFPKKLLDEILDLPRETAIQDLCGMLEAEIHNGPIYLRDNEDSCCFTAIHLLFILSEMRATDALDHALSFYAQHPDVLQFILGDFIWWQPVYGMLGRDLERVSVWMKTPDLSGEGRSYIAEAVCKIALFEPERRAEIIAWAADLLEFLRDSPPNDRILDTGLISEMVTSLVKIQATELISLVSSLYEKKYVSEFQCGTLESIIEDLSSAPNPKANEAPPSMMGFYSFLMKQCASDYSSDSLISPYGHSAASYSEDSYSDAKPVAERNDPCPCGSGKKYKKCCI